MQRLLCCIDINNKDLRQRWTIVKIVIHRYKRLGLKSDQSELLS